MMKDRTGTNLNSLILRAIEVYNKYRSPGATAKLAAIEKDSFIIEFEGPFCRSCDVNDYFEDFIHELEDLSRSLRVKIEDVNQADQRRFRVRYSVKGDYSFVEVDKEALFREFLRDKGLSFGEYLTSNACTRDVILFHFRSWLLEKKLSLKNSYFHNIGLVSVTELKND